MLRHKPGLSCERAVTVQFINLILLQDAMASARPNKELLASHVLMSTTQQQLATSKQLPTLLVYRKVPPRQAAADQHRAEGDPRESVAENGSCDDLGALLLLQQYSESPAGGAQRGKQAARMAAGSSTDPIEDQEHNPKPDQQVGAAIDQSPHTCTKTLFETAQCSTPLQARSPATTSGATPTVYTTTPAGTAGSCEHFHPGPQQTPTGAKSVLKTLTQFKQRFKMWGSSADGSASPEGIPPAVPPAVPASTGHAGMQEDSTSSHTNSTNSSTSILNLSSMFEVASGCNKHSSNNSSSPDKTTHTATSGRAASVQHSHSQDTCPAGTSGASAQLQDCRPSNSTATLQQLRQWQPARAPAQVAPAGTPARIRAGISFLASKLTKKQPTCSVAPPAASRHQPRMPEIPYAVPTGTSAPRTAAGQAKGNMQANTAADQTARMQDKGSSKGSEASQHAVQGAKIAAGCGMSVTTNTQNLGGSAASGPDQVEASAQPSPAQPPRPTHTPVSWLGPTSSRGTTVRSASTASSGAQPAARPSPTDPTGMHASTTKAADVASTAAAQPSVPEPVKSVKAPAPQCSVSQPMKSVKATAATAAAAPQPSVPKPIQSAKPTAAVSQPSVPQASNSVKASAAASHPSAQLKTHDLRSVKAPAAAAQPSVRQPVQSVKAPAAVHQPVKTVGLTGLQQPSAAVPQRTGHSVPQPVKPATLSATVPLAQAEPSAPEPVKPAKPPHPAKRLLELALSGRQRRSKEAEPSAKGAAAAVTEFAKGAAHEQLLPGSSGEAAAEKSNRGSSSSDSSSAGSAGSSLPDFDTASKLLAVSGRTTAAAAASATPTGLPLSLGDGRAGAAATSTAIGMFSSTSALRATCNAGQKRSGGAASAACTASKGDSRALVPTNMLAGSEPQAANALQSQKRWWDVFPISKPKADSVSRRQLDRLHEDARAYQTAYEQNWRLAQELKRVGDTSGYMLAMQQVQYYQQLAETTRAQVRQVALTLHNQPGFWRLDLHGLSVLDAVSKVGEQLKALQLLARGHPGGVLFSIVVGKGLHSRDNVARVRPAVLQYLQDRQRAAEARSGRPWGIKWGLQPGNDGAIEVHIEHEEEAL